MRPMNHVEPKGSWALALGVIVLAAIASVAQTGCGSGEPAGVMAVVPQGRERLPAAQVRLLEVLANQTAMAIERMRSRHAAESDAL